MARRLSNPESRSKNYDWDTTVEYSILQYDIYYGTDVYSWFYEINAASYATLQQ